MRSGDPPTGRSNGAIRLGQRNSNGPLGHPGPRTERPDGRPLTTGCRVCRGGPTVDSSGRPTDDRFQRTMTIGCGEPLSGGRLRRTARRGLQPTDPDKLLVGSGKYVRHVKVFSKMGIPREALVAFLKQVL